MDYLHRDPKTGRLSYRRAYPAELRRYIPKQLVELKRSLGTTNINAPGAMQRFQAAAAEHDAAVGKARKAATRSFDRLDEPTIAYLGKRFEVGLHEGAEQAVKDGKRETNLDGWDWMESEFREWRRDQDFEAAEEYWGKSARGLLETHGYVLDPQDAEGFQGLCMALNDAAIVASTEVKLRLDGGGVIPLPPAPTAPAFRPAQQDLGAANGGATVEQLIKAFRTLKDSQVSPSARAAYDASFRLLTGVLGADRAVGSINAADGLVLFDAVRSLPKNLGKVKALRGLSVLEAIERGRELGLPTIGPKTINDSYVANLRSLFKWAVKKKWIIESPLPDEDAVVDRVAPEEKRDPFSDEQLETIFRSEPWVIGGSEAAKAIHYWGPLIALYMGLRRGEIAQLRVKDFSTVDKTPIVAVAADAGIDGRTGKTANARRRLPVHPELIRLGLLNFVNDQRATKQELWLDEGPDSHGKWGDGLSDWFTRLLSQKDISGKRLGMHSFRHNFEDRLREADLHGTSIGAYMAGRKQADRVGSTYGTGKHPYSSTKLAEAMSRVSYPSVDMSAVRPWVSACTGD